jgi:hypothetical protein
MLINSAFNFADLGLATCLPRPYPNCEKGALGDVEKGLTSNFEVGDRGTFCVHCPTSILESVSAPPGVCRPANVRRRSQGIKRFSMSNIRKDAGFFPEARPRKTAKSRIGFHWPGLPIVLPVSPQSPISSGRGQSSSPGCRGRPFRARGRFQGTCAPLRLFGG